VGYQKPVAKWRPARCQAARPYLPNAFRLQVKISCGIKNYQALLPCIRQAVKSAQGTITIVHCTFAGRPLRTAFERLQAYLAHKADSARDGR
jgi:hypothetical protein